MPKSSPFAPVAVLLVVASPLAFPLGIARAEPLHFGSHDVTSLFTISKSENKNEVVYAIHLDAQCTPIGDAPVFAFWRMHEKGPNVIEPLLSREEGAYGIGEQHVVSRDNGGHVEIKLKALSSRPIAIDVKPGAGKCEAWSELTIGGERAWLYNVYVKLKTLGVEYLLLSGWSMDRTHVVTERVAR